MAYIRCAGNSGGSIKKKTASGSIATFTTAIPTALADVTSVIGYRGSGYTSATAINSKTAPVHDLAPYHTRINNNIGNLALEKLVGVSCVFNQLVPSGYSQSSNGLSPLTNGTQIIQGHKYYISRKLSAEEPVENDLSTKNGGTNKVAFKIFDTQKSTIVNALYSCISDGTTNDTEGNAWLYQYNGGSVVTVSDLNIFDLTAMFGSEVADYIYNLENS